MVGRIARVRRRVLFLSATLAVAWVLMATPAVWAQSAGSTIHGTVKDESGGAMPGVTVTLKSPALQVPQLVVVSDSDAISVRRVAGWFVTGSPLSWPGSRASSSPTFGYIGFVAAPTQRWASADSKNRSP